MVELVLLLMVTADIGTVPELEVLDTWSTHLWRQAELDTGGMTILL